MEWLASPKDPEQGLFGSPLVAVTVAGVLPLKIELLLRTDDAARGTVNAHVSGRRRLPALVQQARAGAAAAYALERRD